MPRLLLETTQYIVILGIELNLVLVEVVEKVVGSQDLGDLDQLIRIALAVEERLLAEDHGRKHCAKAPHVQAVVVLLEIDEQFWAFKIAGRNPDIVLGSRVIELGKTPINET